MRREGYEQAPAPPALAQVAQQWGLRLRSLLRSLRNLASAVVVAHDKAGVVVFLDREAAGGSI